VRAPAWAYTAVTVVSLALITLAGPLARRVEMIGEDDLSRIWAGPRAILTGHDPYDTATWVQTAVALGTQRPDTSVYIYPPWVAVPLLPLGALELRVASGVWLAASLMAAIGVVYVVVRDRLPGRPRDHAVVAATLLLSWVGLLTLIIGQWGYLLVAAVLASFELLRRGRPVAAGFAALAMLAKPQLFLFTAPAFVVHAMWPERPGGPPRPDGVRAVATALAGTLLLIAVGWIVLPSWWPVWLTSVGGQQTRPFSDTLPALLLVAGGPTALLLAPIVLLALVAVALRIHPRSGAWLPVWTALSIVGAPYTNSYDQILLIVPILLAAAALLPHDGGRARFVLWAGCAVLLIVTPLMYEIAVRRHSETLGALVPLAVLAIVTGSLWRYRRESGTLAP
jgi:glycosyl transferase family 87